MKSSDRPHQILWKILKNEIYLELIATRANTTGRGTVNKGSGQSFFI